MLLSCPVRWCGSCSTHPIAVLAGTAVRVVCCSIAGCVVCVGECLCVVFVWWGILCVLPPHSGGGWGRRGWWGAVVVVGGMVSEGRLCCWPPCLVCGVPLVVYPVAVLNGGVVGCVLPRVRIGSGTLVLFCPPRIVLSSSCCSAPPFCCVLWVGRCGGGIVPRFPLLLPTVCVPCHSIVGLVLCLCDRVVLLWNSGDGLCWVEGRVASTVYTSSVS